MQSVCEEGFCDVTVLLLPLPHQSPKTEQLPRYRLSPHQIGPSSNHLHHRDHTTIITITSTSTSTSTSDNPVDSSPYSQWSKQVSSYFEPFFYCRYHFGVSSFERVRATVTSWQTPCGTKLDSLFQCSLAPSIGHSPPPSATSRCFRNFHTSTLLPLFALVPEPPSSSTYPLTRIWLIHILSTVAVLRGDSTVAGTVTFEQSSEPSPTTISYDIKGHDASAERGMHVHQFGDNTNGCTSAGPHCVLPPCPSRSATLAHITNRAFAIVNPFSKTHGAPSDSERHVGDLGNFKTDAEGNAKGSVEDKLIKLIGPESVLGRTIVVHAGTDDLGKGGHEQSKATGNAGGRPACGVIGIAQ